MRDSVLEEAMSLVSSFRYNDVVSVILTASAKGRRAGIAKFCGHNL